MYDIIHLVRIYKPNIGGMEKVVENITKIQIKKNKKILVLTSDFSSKKKLFEIDNGVKILRLRSFTFFGVIIPNLFFFKTKLSTKALHIHGMDPFVDLVSFFINCDNKVISPHGGFFHTKSFNFIKKIYWLIISKKIYKNINSFSISLNDQLLMKDIAKVSYLMGCGITDRNILANGKDILIFGRISKNKRVLLSLKIAKQLLPNTNVNIIGENQDNIKFNVLDKNIIYHGVLIDNDIRKVIKDSRYFICMSKYEGLGIALLEALHCGLRCIVSDITSFNNIISKIPLELKNKFIFVYNVDLNFLNWQKISITELDKQKINHFINKNYSWEKVVNSIFYV